MRHKTFTKEELAQAKLPIRTEELTMNAPLMSMNYNTLEAALAAFPLFGGTSTEQPASPPATTTTTTPATAIAESGTGGQSGDDTSTAAGGDAGQAMSQEQIADLLKQVSTITAQNKQLLTENNTFKSQQQQKERENMGREQALEADLQTATQTIEALDRALKNQAVLNAINSFSEIQFHDPNFVLHELSSDVFEGMEVDLENSRVKVSGIENDLRRIAKEKSWAVKKLAQESPSGNGNGSGPKAPPKGSGAPPAPPGGANDKASRRAALMEKFPVIGHGTASATR